jgi:hypothetical protein
MINCQTHHQNGLVERPGVPPTKMEKKLGVTQTAALATF